MKSFREVERQFAILNTPKAVKNEYDLSNVVFHNKLPPTNNVIAQLFTLQSHYKSTKIS